MEEEKRIIAYKGFDENLCCICFQYKVGELFDYCTFVDGKPFGVKE